jgi:hypothetical protein
VVLEGLQAREVPVAQNPVAADREDEGSGEMEKDEEERQARGLNAPDEAERRRRQA